MAHESRAARGPNYKFVRELLKYGESYVPRVGDVVQTYDNRYEPEVTGTVISVDRKLLTVRPRRGKDVVIDTEEDYVHVEASPTIDAHWTRAMAEDRPEGVAYGDNLVSPELRAALRANVGALARKQPIDYHPGSGTRVRDLVHPSLYPYVRRKSKLVGAAPAAATPPKYDRWGRLYEDSKYQWLPSQFHVDAKGTVAIRSYVNNLASSERALHANLARLFGCAVPLLESVLGYVQNMRFYVEGDPATPHEGELPGGRARAIAKFPPRKLRGRELQVVPKIVEYKLEAGETHEGVWHVEGMSHEHIIATCVYVLERDDALVGGALEFKRAATVQEAGTWFWGMDQNRPEPAQRLVEAAQIPLGRLETAEGRLFVFPNSHIHRLTQLANHGRGHARRRVIVFWVVDPDVTIVSTRDVAPQQQTMSQAEALRIRLELMKERKRHKSSFNIRTISLCEH